VHTQQTYLDFEDFLKMFGAPIHCCIIRRSDRALPINLAGETGKSKYVLSEMTAKL
jgi:hypothetical protein